MSEETTEGSVPVATSGGEPIFSSSRPQPLTKVDDPVAKHAGRVSDQASNLRTPNPRRTVYMCVDDSPHSERAWLWALDNFIRPEDTVVLTTVCVVAARAHVTPHEDTLLREAYENAATLVNKFVEVGLASRAHMINKDKLQVETLLASAASVIGETIVDYLVNGPPSPYVVVLGSRGMGAFQRAISPLIGLGSVSDYVLHHANTCQGVMIVH